MVGGGWGGRVRPSGVLGGLGPVDGWGVDGGGRGVRNTKGTKASEERQNIAGIGDRECAGRAIVAQGEAKKFAWRQWGELLRSRGKTDTRRGKQSLRLGVI